VPVGILLRFLEVIRIASVVRRVHSDLFRPLVHPKDAKELEAFKVDARCHDNPREHDDRREDLHAQLLSIAGHKCVVTVWLVHCVRRCMKLVVREQPQMPHHR